MLIRRLLEDESTQMKVDKLMNTGCCHVVILIERRG